MDPRISVITLGVADLAKSRNFYVEGLGWKSSNTSSSEKIVFIDLGGLVLGLYPRELLAEDATLTPGTGFGGVTLAQNVDSKAEVDVALADAVKAGAKLVESSTTKTWVSIRDIHPTFDPGAEPSPDEARFSVGRSVEARWNRGARYWHGHVLEVYGKLVFIRYDDGMTEWLEQELVRSAEVEHPSDAADDTATRPRRRRQRE